MFQSNTNTSTKRDKATKDHSATSTKGLCHRWPEKRASRKCESRYCHRISDLLIGDAKIGLIDVMLEDSFE